MKRIVLLFFYFALIVQFALSNNVSVSNVRLTGRNTTSHIVYVRFDISWENSWRTSSPPNNWDAVWIFVKFKVGSSGPWQHATLDAGNYTAPTGSAISPAAGGKGAFIYRSAEGPTGTVSFTGVQLQWDYGTDLVSDDAAIIVKVMGIEMVYVPQESFYAGDGATTNITAQFNQGGTTLPFQVTSEGPLTLGGTASTNLANNDGVGVFTPAAADDFNNATTKILPANFPKGYNAFYCMKYELTQEQYVGFLNMLTRTQQESRISAVSAGKFMFTDDTQTGPTFRNGVKCKTVPVGSEPREYGNDLNNDGSYGDPGDGQNLACTYLSWADLAAYLDWACLRPMTELEFEKTCRGPVFPVPNEYAWGDATIAADPYTLANDGAPTEVVTVNYSTTAGNVVDDLTSKSIPGPFRVGVFASSVSDRRNAGASYYGIMELSGNVIERTITVGNETGRAFIGSHGDGLIGSNGDAANVPDWPGIDAVGANRRGGRWSSAAANSGLEVSGRSAAAYTFADRAYYYGIRGVRTAQ
jgi:formylglycine-generating enzyme required for sulfatase activity